MSERGEGVELPDEVRALAGLFTLPVVKSGGCPSWAMRATTRVQSLAAERLLSQRLGGRIMSRKTIPAPVGQTFGDLVVLEELPKAGRERFVRCQCACGNQHRARLTEVNIGRTTRCLKCAAELISFPVAPGDRFGLLEIVSRQPGKLRPFLCRCDCGNEAVYPLAALRRRDNPSCGCAAKAGSSERPDARQSSTGIPRRTHGMSDSPEYRSWTSMNTRCYNQNVPEYGEYGGAGVKVCDRWRSNFQAFLEDMGPKPTADHSLDRKDNRSLLGYCKENCRWATQEEQMENTRRSRLWHVHGHTFPSSRKAAKHFGVADATIVTWCNGYKKGDGRHPPREGCWSELKYPAPA